MDLGTVFGIVIAAGLIMVSVIIGGGSIGAMIEPASLMIVVGGTFGAVLCSFPIARLLKLHKIVLKTVFTKPTNVASLIRELVSYAEIARRDGILALENKCAEMSDPFLIRGVKMAVDGTDPELIKAVMETEVDASSERHAQAKSMLDALAKYAPAFGMIGTLLGLIAMLRNMDDPSKIGPGMALALITTLYGALFANIVAGPLGDKLSARDAEETLIKTVIVTAVLAIQSGDNPRVVESKLLTFLPPSQRADFEQDNAKAKAA